MLNGWSRVLPGSRAPEGQTHTAEAAQSSLSSWATVSTYLSQVGCTQARKAEKRGILLRSYNSPHLNGTSSYLLRHLNVSQVVLLASCACKCKQCYLNK